MFRSIDRLIAFKPNYSSLKLLNKKINFDFETKVYKSFSNLSKNNFNFSKNSMKVLSIERQNYRHLLPFSQRVVYFSNVKNEQKVKLKTEKTSIENKLESIQSKKRSLRKKVTPKQSQQIVMAFSTAEEYNLEDMSEAFKEQGLYELMPLEEEVSEDVIHLCAKYEINHSQREFFIFRSLTIESIYCFL